MEFEWDIKKALSNLKKHGIDFADAVLDEHPNEERFITIGMDAFGCVLIVIHTWRRNRIRIISARKATTREINQYKG